VTPELRALALGGTIADYDQGAVTDQAIQVTAHLDKWVDLGYRNIAAGGVNHATWVEDTDFIVNSARGQIKFLSTGSATEGEAVSLTVTASAVSATRTKGATRPTFYCAVRLSGINQTTGERGTLDIFRVSAAPSGSVDPMSGEFLVTSIKGTLVTPDGLDAPYYWDSPETHS